MSFPWPPASTAIAHATNFLTQPLLLAHPASTLAALQCILQSALTSAFCSCAGTLILSISPFMLPPRPILATCIAANFPWSSWLSVLGGDAFELLITSSRVSVLAHDGKSTTIWEDLPSLPSLPPQSVSSAAASKYSLISVLRSSVMRRTRQQTLAQELLESSHEAEQADEMFTYLSNIDISVVPPTPTTAAVSPTLTQGVPHIPSFADCVHTITFPDSNSDSDSASDTDSRPSSRSSSTFDMSPPSSATSSHSFYSFASSLQSISPKVEREKCVFVDNTRKMSTKYVYAGGVSTVLTGGVMLGSTSPTGASPNTGKDAESGSVPMRRPRMVPTSPAAKS
jgi:hypothetical protein